MERALGPTAGMPSPDDHDGERVRKFRLEVVEGAAKGSAWMSSGGRCSIGSHASNDFVVADDATVSRFHCEITSTPQGFVVRDLDSKNGTVLDGVRIHAAFARG